MGQREILHLDEIQDFIKYLKNFIIDIEICSDNITQIIEAQKEININPIQDFLGHYVYLAFSQCAINCYKLFQKKEKRSFYSLCNKIHEFEYSSELREHLTKNEDKDDGLVKNRREFRQLADEMLDKIGEEADLINKINDRRLTFYAHSDPTKRVESETLAEIKALGEFAKKLFNMIYNRFLGVEFLFNINLASISQVLIDRKMVDDYWKSREEEEL